MSSSGGTGGIGGSSSSSNGAVVNIPLRIPGFLVRQQRAAMYAGGVLCVLSFLCFVACNQGEVAVDLLLLELRASLAWWSLCCFALGVSAATTAFYIRQTSLVTALAQERLASATLQGQVAAARDNYERLRAVASEVTVPYPLDQLVERAGVAAGQLSDVAYKPRQLYATRGKHD
jgi:hypothetical protein